MLLPSTILLQRRKEEKVPLATKPFLTTESIHSPDEYNSFFISQLFIAAQWTKCRLHFPSSYHKAQHRVTLILISLLTRLSEAKGLSVFWRGFTVTSSFSQVFMLRLNIWSCGFLCVNIQYVGYNITHRTEDIILQWQWPHSESVFHAMDLCVCVCVCVLMKSDTVKKVTMRCSCSCLNNFDSYWFICSALFAAGCRWSLCLDNSIVSSHWF